MKLRTVLAAGAGVLGATAVGNRVLRARAGEPRSPLAGDPGTYRWRGMETAYVEGGDPADRDLLLLHGVHAAASNAEFERVFDRLAADYHVLAPDLPGFGSSERPPLGYTGSLYAAFVADLADDLLDDAVCIASSLSAGYAVAAQQRTAAFARLVLVCPTTETGPRRPWLRALLRSPVVGTGLFNALVSRPSLRYFATREAVSDPRAMDRGSIEQFWRTAHQPGARFAPASFVAGFLDLNLDLETALPALSVPVTLVWGADAPFPPLSAGRDLAAAADVRLIVLDGARLLPHHEHPGAFLDGLDAELPALAG